jgi:hypothetical protein
VLANADRHQPPDPMLRGCGAHALGHVSENAVADRPAIKEPVVFHLPAAGGVTTRSIIIFMVCLGEIDD